jgi:hypothetical protein
LAQAFVDLQQARHEADYDLARPPFTRQEAQDLVDRATRAMADLEAVGSTPHGEAFLVCLLTRKKLDRR